MNEFWPVDPAGPLRHPKKNSDSLLSVMFLGRGQSPPDDKRVSFLKGEKGTDRQKHKRPLKHKPMVLRIKGGSSDIGVWEGVKGAEGEKGSGALFGRGFFFQSQHHCETPKRQTEPPPLLADGRSGGNRGPV